MSTQNIEKAIEQLLNEVDRLTIAIQNTEHLIDEKLDQVRKLKLELDRIAKN
jgi:prefoldin subunit 5